MTRDWLLTAALVVIAAPMAWAGAGPTKEVGASRNPPGYVTEGQFSNSHLGALDQPQPQLPKAGPVYGISGPWPLYTAKLHPGHGMKAVERNCSICHAVTYITMQPPLPAGVWKAEVGKMMNVMGAKRYIPEATAKEIIGYLQTYYVPGKRKQ